MRLLLLACTLLCLMPLCDGQTFNAATSIGAPGTVFSGSNIDKVDLMSGALSVNLPLIKIPGREIPLEIGFTYASKLWETDYLFTGNGNIVPAQAFGGTLGWIGQKGMLISASFPSPTCVHYVNDADGNAQCDKGYVQTGTVQYTDGSRASLIGDSYGSALASSSPGGLYTYDGTYRMFDSKGMVDRSGTRSDFTSVVTPNGNSVRLTFDPGDNHSIYVDTLGNKVHDQSSSQTHRELSYTDDSGATRKIIITYTIQHVKYPCTGYYCGANGPYHQTYSADYGDAGDQALPQSIQLADGATYTFEYLQNGDGTTSGELTKLTLPTGGYVRYTYGLPPRLEAIDNDARLFYAFGEYRVVRTRSVSESGQAGDEQTWTYSIWDIDSSTQQAYSSVSDPVGTKHREFFNPWYFGPPQTPGSDGQNTIQFTAPGVQVRSDTISASGGTLSSSVSTIEADDSSYSAIAIASSNHANYRPTRIVTTNDAGQQSAQDLSYSSFGNIARVQDSDWGNNAPGTNLRTLSKTYLVDADSRYSAPSTHILDRVTEEIVSGYCSSDRPAGNCSEVDYTYDNYQIGGLAGGLQATSQATNHDYGSYGTGNLLRGNKTSAMRAALQGEATGRTIYAYDDLGNIVALQDPKGNVSRFDYTDNFAGMAGETTLAFVTAQTSATVGSVSLKSRAQFFRASGMMAAKCGPNFPSGSLCQAGLGGKQADYQTWSYDLLFRPKSETQGDGGTTTASYPDEKHITIVNWIGSSATYSYDGLGRQVQKAITSDSCGATYVDTAFDQIGRLYSESNPYRSAGSSCGSGDSGGDSYLYDGLDRRIRVTHADGSYREDIYTGSQVQRKDERQRPSTETSDGLGRLVGVSDAIGGVTSYSYDALGNLLSANQSGTSGETPRMRSFTYDSLSRLITATNPETGTICYGLWSGSSVGTGKCQGGYDANGNVLAKTNARGMGMIFEYDALNRLTSNTYFSPSGRNSFPIAAFFYDGSVPGGRSGAQGGNQLGRMSGAHHWAFFGTGSQDEVQAYDEVGRVVTRTEFTPSGAANVSRSVYDPAGNRTHLVYPSGRAITIGFDTESRPVSVHDDATGKSYVSAVSYHPNQTPNTTTFAGGLLKQTDTINSRLQICESKVGLASGASTYLDRQYFFGDTASPGDQCNSASQNNGNLLHVLDATNANFQQHYQYDQLNRVKRWNGVNQLSITRQQGYGYDSFGNMLASWDSSTPAVTSNRVDAGNHFINQGGNDCTAYDEAGNMICAGTRSSDEYDSGFNEEDQLVVFQHKQNNSPPLYIYNYDVSGNRSRSDNYSNGSYREYSYLEGQLLADRDNNGAWTDYVYVGGRRIARIRSFAAGSTNTVTVRFPDDSCSACVGAAQGGGDRNLAVQSVVINGMALNGTQGSPSSCTAGDPNPGTIWLNCAGDLNFNVSGPISSVSVNAYSTSDYGQFAHMQVLVNGDLMESQLTTSSATAYSADPALHYVSSDYLGTAQIEFSALGTVLWQGEFTPFGQELSDPSSTGNRFKFTGKERDIESGLDYFGARFYASPLGRFMSPDWSGKPEAIPYSILAKPQSLNLYAYVENNPLTQVDVDGHCPWCVGAAVGAALGGGFEAFHEYRAGKGFDGWKIAGAALKGGVTGAVAVATGGSSLLTQAGALAGANAAGGVVSRAIDHDDNTKALDVKAVVTDTVAGAGGGLAGGAASSLLSGEAGAMQTSIEVMGNQGDRQALGGLISGNNTQVAAGQAARGSANTQKMLINQGVRKGTSLARAAGKATATEAATHAMKNMNVQGATTNNPTKAAYGHN